MWFNTLLALPFFWVELAFTQQHPLTPHRAAMHVGTAKYCQCHTFFMWGSSTCMCSSVLLSLTFSGWCSPVCGCHSFTIPPRGVAPHKHTEAPYCLYAFSGHGSPAGGYCFVLLAPYYLQVEEPLVFTSPGAVCSSILLD